jgi:hypothetical protein
MMPQAIVLMQGMCAAIAMAIGLFFLSFWKRSGDRLFLYFAIAFWLMGSSWALLGLVAPEADNRPYVYGLRLLAFLLVIVAIIDKSRSPSS